MVGDGGRAMTELADQIIPTRTAGVKPIRVRLAEDATVIHHDEAGRAHEYGPGSVVELPGAMAMHYVVMGVATIDQ